jgi:ComF family protein
MRSREVENSRTREDARVHPDILEFSRCRFLDFFPTRSIADTLIAVAFAPVCLSCGQVLEAPTRSPACDRCWQNLRRYTPPWCPTCGAPLARADMPHECLPEACAVSTLRALGPYDGVLRDLLHALKFDRRRSLAARLGALLRSSDGAVFRGADALVPVPLHPWRQWRRGFNQATDLANAVSGAELPVWRAIRRRRATTPQFDLDADARRDNVRAAFAIAGWLPRQRARWSQRIARRTLVLVDDVTTTGATLDSCAQVLLEHGAREVRAVTIGRVMLDRSRT